jgi:hypothetical protein
VLSWLVTAAQTTITPRMHSARVRGSPSEICNKPGKKLFPYPAVDSGFHPIRHRNGSYVAALADSISDDPVLLAVTLPKHELILSFVVN